MMEGREVTVDTGKCLDFQGGGKVLGRFRDSVYHRY